MVRDAESNGSCPNQASQLSASSSRGLSLAQDGKTLVKCSAVCQARTARVNSNHVTRYGRGKYPSGLILA